MENINPNTTIKNNEIVNVHTTNPLNTNPAAANNETINVREVLLKYLNKWYWFVISLIICVAIAYVYLKITNEQFQVQTTILLRKDQSAHGLIDMSMLDGFGVSASSKEVEDEIQVLTSKTLMTKVIKSLEIETEYAVKQGWRYEVLYPVSPLKLVLPAMFNDTLKQSVELRIHHTESGYEITYKSGRTKEKYAVADLSKPLRTPVGALTLYQMSPIKVGDKYKIVTHPINQLTEGMAASIRVAAVNKKSNAISISTVSSNVRKSEAILNELTRQYNMDAVIDKNMIAMNTAAFVDERLKLIQIELKGVEMNVESYKKQNKLTDISSEAELFLKSASEYDKKIAELETQLNLIEYIETYVKDIKNQYSLVPANLGIEDKSLLELMQEYNQALLERMKLKRTTNDRNPVLIQMEQQLKEIRSSIILSIVSIKDGLKIARKDVMSKDAQFASKIKDVPKQEREFLEIKRQQEIKQKLYLFLLQKREENALSLASTIASAKTLDAAYASISPVAPKRMMVLLVACMLGLLLPVGFIYVDEMLNDKISDKKDLLKLIKVPFLGSIALNKENDRIVVREGKTTPIVEMFRLVRTNMGFMLSGMKSPVILVTSTISGEGKSFTAINMAMSFALMNKKVVLIGLDVRNPMLGEYMHISKAVGISVYLSDPSYRPHDIIIPSGFHPFLDVIPAGPVPPNPAELLMSTRLEDLIALLKKDYDYIIIDSAPVGIVSDTYLLSRVVDNCIYVTRQNYTPREASNLINDIHKHKRINKVGVVLNGTDESLGYGYGYGYGYGSGSGNTASQNGRGVTVKKIADKLRNK